MFAGVATLGSAVRPDGRNPHPVRLVRPAATRLSAMAQLGRYVFFDPALSSSGKISCASCHSPQHAYGPPDVLPISGARAVPSLMYLERQTAFSVGPDAAESDGTSATPPPAGAVPQGGLFWDGRADTLQSQALGPLLNPLEMNGGSLARVATVLRHAPYASRFVQLFGPAIFERAPVVVSEALFAVGRYQIEATAFHPYSSKYDFWLEGKATLSTAEARGLALFDDPKRANCAACHLDRPSAIGMPPLFTDAQYEAVGVPRNGSPAAYDLGICGPQRTDMKAATQYCGMFLTPTLRNAATRHQFFHNGVYHTLKQVVDFYDFRDTRPERIYPRRRDGAIAKFDDLPAKYRANIDTTDAPFDRKLGAAPPLNPAEERDLIAFLQTLTDGYRSSR
jgi:cytochrome c peroxidase